MDVLATCRSEAWKGQRGDRRNAGDADGKKPPHLVPPFFGTTLELRSDGVIGVSPHPCPAGCVQLAVGLREGFRRVALDELDEQRARLVERDGHAGATFTCASTFKPGGACTTSTTWGGRPSGSTSTSPAAMFRQGSAASSSSSPARL
jgi:hypothetical protein